MPSSSAWPRQQSRPAPALSADALAALRRPIRSPATCANWRTSSNARWRWPTTTASTPPTCACPPPWPTPSPPRTGGGASRQRQRRPSAGAVDPRTLNPRDTASSAAALLHRGDRARRDPAGAAGKPLQQDQGRGGAGHHVPRVAVQAEEARDRLSRGIAGQRDRSHEQKSGHADALRQHRAKIDALRHSNSLHLRAIRDLHGRFESPSSDPLLWHALCV